MPFPVCWVYWRALDMRLALDTLATTRAINLAFSDKDTGADARRAVVDDALPPAG